MASEGKSSKQNSARWARDLWAAVRTGSVPDVEAALAVVKRNSGNVDARDRYGSTALHIATWRNHVPIARRLIDAGADPDGRDGESGWGCLHRALHFGHLAVAGTLIRAGASLLLEDAKGRFPADLVSGPLKLLPEAGAREVFSWGNGSNYQLGTGSEGIQRVPCRVEALQGLEVVAISASKFHSVAVTSRGEVFSWGYARGGRLGHPDCNGEAAEITPRLITSGLSGRRIKAIAAAKHHTIVATDGGEVYSWGSNREGQLGYPSVDTQNTPRRISTLRFKVVAVAAANKHSVAITEAGEVFTWGCNREGQLGYGTSNSASNCVPRCVESLKGKNSTTVSAAKYHTVVIVDGEVFTWGHKMVTPRRVAITRKSGTMLKFHKFEAFRVCAIAAGVVHSTAVSEEGLVFTWSSSDPNLHANQLGSMAGHHVVSVSAGKCRTAVTTSLGDVFAWEGEDCIAVREHGIKHTLQLAVGEKHSLAIAGICVPPYASKVEGPDASLATSPRLNDSDSEDDLEIEADKCRRESPKRRETPSLMSLCQKVLAEAVAEPKNALQLLDVAESLGANELRLYCEEFVLRNLDYVLTVAPAAFGTARSSLLAELEKSWDIASWNHRQLPVPSAVLPAVVDSEDDNDVSPRTRKIELIPAAQVTDFLPDNADAGDDRRAKHLRAIRKKLQQIETLELKRLKGQTLDEQQLSKLRTKGALLKELGYPDWQNESGSCDHNLSTEQQTKHQRRKRNKSSKALIDSTKEDVEKPPASEEEFVLTKAAPNVEEEPVPEPPKSTPEARQQRKKPAKSRKGGLSLFLSGALETKETTPVEQPPPVVVVKAEGPVWGGALPHRKGPLSLRDIIQNEQEASSSQKQVQAKSPAPATPRTASVSFGAASSPPSRPRPKTAPITIASPQSPSPRNAANAATPWVGAVSPGSVASLRDIQMQQVKQKEKQRAPTSRGPQSPLAVAGASSSTPPEAENCWFKPDSTSSRSSIRCIQIEERAMKDLRKLYKNVKLVQE